MPEVLPFARSYWVVPGRFLAGCVPVTHHPDNTRRHLENLLALGIRTFVSLVEADECNFEGVPIPGYEEEVRALAEQQGLHIEYHQPAYRDGTVPAPDHMERILDIIDAALERRAPVFLHCWGGRGRTGTVVGCWLARHGMAQGEFALQMIQYLRRTDPLAHTPSPETGEQIAMVRTWPQR